MRANRSREHRAHLRGLVDRLREELGVLGSPDEQRALGDPYRSRDVLGVDREHSAWADDEMIDVCTTTPDHEVVQHSSTRPRATPRARGATSCSPSSPLRQNAASVAHSAARAARLADSASSMVARTPALVPAARQIGIGRERGWLRRSCRHPDGTGDAWRRTDLRPAVLRVDADRVVVEPRRFRARPVAAGAITASAPRTTKIGMNGASVFANASVGSGASVVVGVDVGAPFTVVGGASCAPAGAAHETTVNTQMGSSNRRRTNVSRVDASGLYRPIRPSAYGLSWRPPGLPAKLPR